MVNQNGGSYIELPSVGWICPICGRANAPYVGQCPCPGEKVIHENNSTEISESEENIDWERVFLDGGQLPEEMTQNNWGDYHQMNIEEWDYEETKS